MVEQWSNRITVVGRWNAMERRQSFLSDLAAFIAIAFYLVSTFYCLYFVTGGLFFRPGSRPTTTGLLTGTHPLWYYCGIGFVLAFYLLVRMAIATPELDRSRYVDPYQLMLENELYCGSCQLAKYARRWNRAKDPVKRQRYGEMILWYNEYCEALERSLSNYEAANSTDQAAAD